MFLVGGKLKIRHLNQKWTFMTKKLKVETTDGAVVFLKQ
jgi:hypothetical protein